jgi:electron transport complex protein RnfG
MSDDAVSQAAPQTPGFRMVRTLGVIAMLSGLLVVLVYQWTAPIIAENQRIAIEKAVFEVVPGASRRVDLVLGEQGLFDAGDPAAQGETVYAAFDDQDRLQGVALTAGAQGYQDVIRLIYGYDPQCSCIRGIKILKMTETPGLGDRIATDPEFQANFERLDARLDRSGDALAHPIETVKSGTKRNPWEIDAISGATISAVAVGKALNASMQRMAPLVQRHLAEIAGAGK